MTKQETLEERKLRFEVMSSYERKALLRKKMKAEGLEEGSEVKPCLLMTENKSGI